MGGVGLGLASLVAAPAMGAQHYGTRRLGCWGGGGHASPSVLDDHLSSAFSRVDLLISFAPPLPRLPPSLPPSLPGVRGFLAGLGAGLAGCVVLPVAGMVGGVSYIVGKDEDREGERGGNRPGASWRPWRRPVGGW